MKESFLPWCSCDCFDAYSNPDVFRQCNALIFMGLTSNAIFLGHFDPCPETSESDYPVMRCHISEWNPQLHHCENLQTRHSNYILQHVVCLTSGPQPPTNQVHTVRFNASFKLQYLLVSPKSFSSCFCLLPRLPIPAIFLSIMWFRRQFLRKIWPIQLAYLHIIVCRMFLSFLTNYSSLHGLYLHKPEPIEI